MLAEGGLVGDVANETLVDNAPFEALTLTVDDSLATCVLMLTTPVVTPPVARTVLTTGDVVDTNAGTSCFRRLVLVSGGADVVGECHPKMDVWLTFLNIRKNRLSESITCMRLTWQLCNII